MFSATGIMHCSFHNWHYQSESRTAAHFAVPLYAEKNGLYVACLERSAAGGDALGDWPLNLSDWSRWSRAVSGKHRKANLDAA